MTLRSYILTKGTPKQRLQSTYGYWLLQQMLHYTAAGNLDDLLWLPSGHPVWKKQLPPFSISHSGTIVGVALSQLGRIGLDIQDLRPLPASAVDSIFFNTNEQQIIQQASANHSFLIECKYTTTSQLKNSGRGITFFNQKFDNGVNEGLSWFGINIVVSSQDITQNIFCNLAKISHPADL